MVIRKVPQRVGVDRVGIVGAVLHVVQHRIAVDLAARRPLHRVRLSAIGTGRLLEPGGRRVSTVDAGLRGVGQVDEVDVRAIALAVRTGRHVGERPDAGVSHRPVPGGRNGERVAEERLVSRPVVDRPEFRVGQA